MTTTPTTSTPHRRTTTPHDEGVLLADALSANALFSAATGVVLAIGSPVLDETLGVHAALLAGLGVGLLGFAGAVVAGLTRPSRLRRFALAVIAADVAWVLAAVVVVAADVLTTTGTSALVAVTVPVACVAIVQAVGHRRARGAPRPGVRPIALVGAREVPAPPDEAWAAVADAAGYAAHAPGIAETTTDGEVADGMRRTCVDDGGRSWHETCRLLEPRRAYRMEVDTATYPLRHRLVFDHLALQWRVVPRGAGSRIELSFVGGVRLGLLGRAALATLTGDAPHEVILDRYAAELGA